MAQNTPRAKDSKLTHCPPSSKWRPGGGTREIKVAKVRPYKADGHGQLLSLTFLNVQITHTTCFYFYLC